MHRAHNCNDAIRRKSHETYRDQQECRYHEEEIGLLQFTRGIDP
jgi:hypothetical protein